jgi:GNAT superfamily N-acetyltransferase
MRSHLGGLVIEPALPSQAVRIRSLLAAGLGENALNYTIYQAVESWRYLASLCTGSGEAREHLLVAAREEGNLVGYYHARFLNNTAFLNYVVVDPAFQGRGIGTTLLKHLESAVRQRGQDRLALEVLAPNTRAVSLYSDRGFTVTSRLVAAELLLPQTRHPQGRGLRLSMEEALWNRALEEERQQGFSKIELSHSKGPIVIGLLAGRVFRLLSSGQVPLQEAIRAVAHSLGRERPTLLLWGVPCVPVGCHVLRSEWILRMEKRVHDGPCHVNASCQDALAGQQGTPCAS